MGWGQGENVQCWPQGIMWPGLLNALDYKQLVGLHPSPSGSANISRGVAGLGVACRGVACRGVACRGVAGRGVAMDRK